MHLLTENPRAFSKATGKNIAIILNSRYQNIWRGIIQWQTRTQSYQNIFAENNYFQNIWARMWSVKQESVK